MTALVHPLNVDTTVTGTKPGCACKGPNSNKFQGKVLKVINNQGAYWYYLDNHVTVRWDWVEHIVE